MDGSSERFRQAMRRLASTVSIVSSFDGRSKHGMTVTALCSVSVDPPTLLVCINALAATHEAVALSGSFYVNILRYSQAALSRLFSGRLTGEERFQCGAWEQRPDGVPFLTDAQANLFCTVDKSLRHQSHTIFFGRVLETRVATEIVPLIYQNGEYGRALPLEPAAG